MYQHYEQKDVFGDEKKFINSSNRLQQMIRVLRELETPPRLVLDSGCGTGYFSAHIESVFPHAMVHGIEISQAAIDIGTKEHPRMIFHRENAETQLSFPDSMFDLVVSGEHIEHLVDVDMYVLEINRILKPGGVLLLTTPNLASWFNRLLLLVGRQPFYLEPSYRKQLPIFSYFGRTFPEDLSGLPAGHLRLFTHNALTKLLGSYGFKIEASYGASYFQKPVVKFFDTWMNYFPSLSSGLVLKVVKEKDVHESA